MLAGGYSGGGAGRVGLGAPGGSGGSFAFSTFNVPGVEIVGNRDYTGSGQIYIYGPY